MKINNDKIEKIIGELSEIEKQAMLKPKDIAWGYLSKKQDVSIMKEYILFLIPVLMIIMIVGLFVKSIILFVGSIILMFLIVLLFG